MHIILYVLDALRADHLGCYGYGRETSPHIDALAQDGVVFENCFTSTTWTRPVAASILTGTYPAVHLTRSRYDMFSTSLTRLPESLNACGYRTAAFSTMGNVAGDLGFKRGFDVYHDLFSDPAILAKRQRLDAAKEGLLHTSEKEVALPLAEDVNEYLFPWLVDNKSANTFSFIWSIQTHEPYRAPEQFRRFTNTALRPGEGESDDIRASGLSERDRLLNLYDDEIYYNDHCIGEIVQFLKQENLYDETLFLIISDHGEAFYEHGAFTHGHAPFEELIHVPMIIKLSDSQHAGTRVTALAELIDIFPTLIAATGLNLETPPLIQGHNLLPLIDKNRQKVRDYCYSDTHSLPVHNHYLSIRSQRWKYIQVKRPEQSTQMIVNAIKHILERGLLLDILRHPRHFLRKRRSGANEYLFDLETDPNEQQNLAAENPDQLTHLRYLLAEWYQQNETLAQPLDDTAGDNFQQSEHLRRHLERLGYM